MFEETTILVGDHCRMQCQLYKSVTLLCLGYCVHFWSLHLNTGYGIAKKEVMNMVKGTGTTFLKRGI